MSELSTIMVEIACALPEKSLVETLTVNTGCTAQQAVNLSAVQATFPELSLAECRLGVFSKVLDDPSAHVLVDGDRVEIYRPLLLDPKDARRQRAQTARRRD